MIPLEIRFKGCLTYAEKLMLKRHRRTQLGTLPTELMENCTLPDRSDEGDQIGVKEWC
jgi:hypothetical protein